MIVYITRKFPPSIGGMQRFNQKLTENLAGKIPFRLIAWGRSQRLMPCFLVYAALKTLRLGMRGEVTAVYLSDGLMAPLGVVLKKLLGVPVAVNIHGRDIAFAFPGYLTVVPWALRRLDRVICVSRSLREICRGYGVPEKILEVIPNGVDVADFAWTREERPDRVLGRDFSGKTVLVTVGRLVPKKGVDRFVRDILPAIVRAEPAVVYLVAGDGPLREEIVRTARAAGVEENLVMLGDLPMKGDLLKAAYCAADIFVMPNVRVSGDIEGFGIVAIEGGAAGLPVVASKLQGIREAVVEGENGDLLPWDDPGAFVDALLSLIRDPARRRRAGDRARAFVAERYGWDSIAGRYASVFRRLVDAGASTRRPVSG